MNERHIMCQSRLAVELTISSNLSGGQDKAILDILVQDARDKIGSIDNRDFSIVVRATQDGTVLGVDCPVTLGRLPHYPACP
ncbi:hypothetical protein RAA17_23445 [Komagataeibacter rhaeticus]|nr:hypothetical protein [Komagataeibacter rhaeticus]